MKVFNFLLVVLCWYQGITAQNTELIVFYADERAQKKVLNLDKETNSLVLTEKSNTTPDTYFDAFIIKQSEDNPATVFLISAQENNLFLKRDGNNLVFREIQEETNIKDYQWEIQYFGYPYIALCDPTKDKSVVYMQNGVLSMKNVPNASWNLSSNDDDKGNSYRYKIGKIVKTF